MMHCRFILQYSTRYIFIEVFFEIEITRDIFSLVCAYYPLAKCQGSDNQLNSLLFGCQSYVRARSHEYTQCCGSTLYLACVCSLVKAVMQARHVGRKSCFLPFTSLFFQLASSSVDGFVSL